jgi:hypothetical protein
MRTGRATWFALVVLALAVPAAAQVRSDELLSCAAEFAARATYAKTLGHSEAGHMTFLERRLDIFLRLAEDRAPKTMIGCGLSGLSQKLLLCFGQPDLHDARSALADDHLMRLVEGHGGQHQLSVCMVDETCAACLALFNRVVREEYPEAWATMPP